MFYRCYGKINGAAKEGQGMNQEEIMLEFLKAVCDSARLDYAEPAVLSVAESQAERQFIKRVFRMARDRRPLLLEIGGGGQTT